MEELLTEAETRALAAGGGKPWSATTLWRYRRAGLWPEPVRIGRAARYRHSECLAARERIISEGLRLNARGELVKRAEQGKRGRRAADNTPEAAP